MTNALLFQNLKGAELSIVLVNNARMLKLNSEYRGIKKTTDVLSFPMYETLPPNGQYFLLGDIIINIHLAMTLSIQNTASAEAAFRPQGRPLPLHEDILLELMVHGLLHLIGYDHEKSETERQKMKQAAEDMIDAIKKMDNKS